MSNKIKLKIKIASLLVYIMLVFNYRVATKPGVSEKPDV